MAVDREGVGVLDAEDAFSVKIYLCLGLGEVLLEHLWVPHRVEVGVTLGLLCGQPFL